MNAAITTTWQRQEVAALEDLLIFFKYCAMHCFNLKQNYTNKI